MENKIDRKEFIKIFGGATVAGLAMAYGCNPFNSRSLNGKVLSLDDISPELMEYRSNPYSGDKVSLLGYGCMRLPLIRKGETEVIIDQEQWNELVDDAIAYGVNYFDTSPVYSRGQSEKVTGIALSRHPRESYLIATKLSNFSQETQSREASIAMYENSFKQLQVDHIDYYLLHSVGMGGMKHFNHRYVDNGMIDFLLKEKEKGRIRNLGFSFHGDVDVFDNLLAMDIQWDFAQIQMNYVDWHHASGANINAEYLYNELVKHNVPAIVMEPLLGGRLANLNKISGDLLRKEDAESSLASWAFRFAGTPSNVLTVLSGMTYKEHLIDNLHTYSPLKKLKEDDYEVLEKAALQILKYPLIACTECDYCMPCPYGIDIPGVFSHYNKSVTEGNFPKSSNDENFKEARRAFLVSYDRSVPKLRQASHCTACNQCVSKCPQRIKIPQEMTKINKYVEDLKQGREFKV